VACSPSSVLLLHRAERSAGRACEQERRDGCRDEPVPEEVIPDRRQWDEVLWARCAWDASDDVRRVVTAGAAHQHHRRVPWDADAGKWAGQERDVLERDASFPLVHWFVQPAQRDAAAAPYIRDAGRSAEQSCAAQAVAAALKPRAQPDERERLALEVQSMPKSKEMPAQTAQRSKVERAQPRDAEARLQTVQRE